MMRDGVLWLEKIPRCHHIAKSAQNARAVSQKEVSTDYDSSKKEWIPHDALTAKSHARPLFSSPTATSSSDLYNISDDDSGKLCKT